MVLKNVVAGGGVHAAQRLIQQVEPGGTAHRQAELHFFSLCALAHGTNFVPPADMQVGQHGVCLDFVKIGEEIRVQAYGIVGGELRRQGHTVRQIAGDGLGEKRRQELYQ